VFGDGVDVWMTLIDDVRCYAQCDFAVTGADVARAYQPAKQVADVRVDEMWRVADAAPEAVAQDRGRG